jgi:FHA domain-containing protein/uncharacterized protein DUF1707
MALADAPTPLPGRASDADRDRVASLLRAGTVDGRISTDTFIDRIERALGARSRNELDHLVADVRTPGPLRRAALRSVTWLSSLTADLQAAWREPRVPPLALPRAGVAVTIGRSPACDCQLAEPSVSRRHAQLRADGERWLLTDLGSRNGTRVNGVRVTGEVEVRPGDTISLAGVRFRAAVRAR